MKPYPPELRERAIKTYQTGEYSIKAVAKLYQIGEKTLRLWMDRLRRTGSLKPDKKGKPRELLIKPIDYDRVRELVAEHPDWSLDEYREEWNRRTGLLVSNPTMSRVLSRIKLTRKKNSSRS